MHEFKIFGVCNALAVLGLVFGLASTAVAVPFTAASVEPVRWLDAGAGVSTGGTFTWADQSDGGATHNATQTDANRHQRQEKSDVQERRPSHLLAKRPFRRVTDRAKNKQIDTG